MGIASHRCVDVVGGASALVQCHLNLLLALLISVSSTSFLHICRCVARYVRVVRESASKLRLVTVSPGVLALLVRLILSVRLLIVHDLNILIIIIIISFLALGLESSDRHPL